jgi:tetratricopeptide (TPR) repeat protein
VIKRIVLAVHWWNPLVYIINREHEQAREEVSDNYVLRELHPKVYTQCLADLAEKVCLISNFPTAVGMAGKCFSLPTRVEHILSKKRSVSMCAKIYVKTITFATCLVLTFGVAGLHGKVISERPGDAVKEKQENRSTINPVSLFDDGQSVLKEKATEPEMIEKQDQDESRVISNAGTTLQTESSDKPALKRVSPAIVIANAGIQTGKNPEKKAESVRAAQEPVLNTGAEDRVVLAQEEPPVKVSSDGADVLETKIIEPKSEDAAAYISRGVSCFKKGQIEDAIADFDKAIGLDPEKAVAYFARGSAYYELDQFDNAISDYNKAIELNPQFAAAYQNRGYFYHSKNEYIKAISDYNKALEFNPENADVYFLRGLVYSSKGKIKKARSEFDKVIALNPEADIAEVAKEYRDRPRFGYAGYNTSSSVFTANSGGGGMAGAQTFASSLEGKTGPPWPDYRP